ncbi:putative F-box/kelch-repeat protein [Iris pallida]|uniref:F-box/kelch-repeat protein n=1 Tax=Iris pallida TaxID=29817 RepID=A0AAX6HW37_IRIPA|nr:putative F-box/kelch-repeat protein [Iris pallida]
MEQQVLLIPGLPDDMARECLTRVPFAHFAAAASVCKQWKREIDSPSFHSMRSSNGHARSILALVQAQAQPDDVERSKAATFSPSKYRLVIFDPSSDTWQSLPPIPGHPHGLPLFCRIVAVGRQLLVVGGWDPATWAATDGVHVYDFVSAAWRRGAPVPGPRRSFFACAGGPAGWVAVAGGHGDGKIALRSALAYDVAGDRWVPLPDMARERDECGGFFAGGRFYAAGGYCTEMQGSFSSSAEAFDFDSWEWGPVEEDYADSDGFVSRKPAALPEDVRAVSQLVALPGGGGGGGGLTMVIGSAKDGGAQVCYLRREGDDKWTEMRAPAEYSGHIQSACCLSI